MTFPALIPTTRTWSPGTYPATAWAAMGGNESRVRHSTLMAGSELRLSFVAITEANMLALLAHYVEVSGSWASFSLPAAVWSGTADPTEYLPAGYGWRYSGPPDVRDYPCGGHDVTLSLVSVPPAWTVAPGADLVVMATIGTTQLGYARGARLTVAASITGGGAGVVLNGTATGATLTVTAGIAGGGASGAVSATASGASLTVTASIIGGGAGESDSSFSNVILLLHMDGSNNSTTFTDNSSNGLTATVTGGAKLSTAQKQFGSAAGLFNGSTDSLEYGSSAIFNTNGGSPFTVECWIWPAVVTTANKGIFSFDNGTAVVPFNIAQNAQKLYWLIGNAALNSWQSTTASASVLTVSTWHHIALVGDGTNIKLYCNGTSVNSTSHPSWPSANRRFYVGAAKDGTFFNGYIDEFRFTKGVARYTANFTPPSAPFPNS